MSHIFPRSTTTEIPVAVAGDGCYLIDADGKRYLDASGGAAVSCLGHSDAAVRAAVKKQLDEVAFAHTGFFSSEPAEALADLLVQHAPGDLERVYFVSGGSEAVEAAIKLARQYFIERGEPERDHIIGRLQSYHGNTLGALGAGGNQLRRAPFAALLGESSHIEPCFEYRYRAPDESVEAYGLRAANALEQEVLRVGANRVMCFIAETVVGATAGAVAPVPGYLKRVREICDEYGILLILDEVMCGMGRTGTLFACEQDGIAPDICTIAKGLGAGYQPIGAMLSTANVYETIRDGSGFFQHGHTYLGHPVACAAGHAVVSSILERELLPRVRVQGIGLRARLDEAFAEHPHVGDIRGRGLFLGVELVADRASGRCFDPSLKIHARIKQAAFERGLICYPSGGTVDGREGDHVLLAPPYIISDGELDELVKKLADTVNHVTAAIA